MENLENSIVDSTRHNFETKVRNLRSSALWVVMGSAIQESLASGYQDVLHPVLLSETLFHLQHIPIPLCHEEIIWKRLWACSSECMCRLYSHQVLSIFIVSSFVWHEWHERGEGSKESESEMLSASTTIIGRETRILLCIYIIIRLERKKKLRGVWN